MRNRSLSIASTLAWLWAALVLLGVVSIGLPMLAQGTNLLPLIPNVILAILSLLSAIGLRKQSKSFLMLTILCSTVAVAFLLVSNLPIGIVGTAVNIGIVVLVSLNWKHAT